MTKFTDQLFDMAQPVWIKSYKHPFIKEIASGELAPSVFRYYLLQDRYYLEEFGTIHGLAAQKSSDARTAEFLRANAENLKNGEVEIRKAFFQQLAISSDEIQLTPIAPSAYNYVNHMYEQLYHGTTQRTIASLLPCYWLYNEIGKRLIAEGSPVSLYQQWIATYDSEAYTEDVQTMLDLTNQAASEVDEQEREAMKQAFYRSSIYELRFWEMAYTMERWDS